MTPTGIVIVLISAFLALGTVAYFVAKKTNKPSPLGFAFGAGLLGMILALFSLKIYTDATKNHSPEKK